MRTDFVYITAVFCLALLYLTESCNVELVATGKPTLITSPGYGKSLYPNNLTCWWKVVASNNDSNVVVDVVHSRIEYAKKCIFDNLTLYDGFNTSSPRIATICGTQTETYVSTNNTLYIRFKTDFAERSDGFKLKVYERPKCVYHLTATTNSSLLKSPGFPDDYSNNLRCTWVISAENENDTVVLQADRLYLVNSFRCFDDYITVFNGNTTNANDSLGTFCGGSYPSFQSSKNQLTIQFITNGSAVSSGFYMHYRSMKANDCNRTMHANSDVLYIVSPGYPDDIQNDTVCVWTIFSRTSQVIYSGVANTIGEPNDCGNDSLTFYSGYGSRRLGSFCVNSTDNYRTSSSVMRIVFKSGETIGMNGFKIAYVASNAPTWIPSIPNWYPDLTNWNSYVPNFNPVDTNNWNSNWNDGYDDDSYSYSYTGYGIGGGVGLFVVIIAGGTAKARSKRRRPAVTATRVRTNRQGIDNVVASSADTGSSASLTVFEPPPPYCEVVKTEQSSAVGTKAVTPP